ncbi:LytR C-terminal domain-containing protein [Patescibacteria group bacterium]|nr:LytR C-terminal domain-containing protein [Patescibacteria group bacterium]MCL5798105.1 LytR C-terminal domain-containing protein [Patescibacteria group bacterium]
MKPAKQRPAIVYLNRQQLIFFGSTITSPIKLDIPETVVHNMEIINRDEFNILIKAFIEFYKIMPSRLIVVISHDIYFEKDFPHLKENVVSDNMQQFLDMIPFENIASRLYHLETISKIIAGNKEVYSSIKMAFEAKGFAIEAIIPEFILEKYIDMKNGINAEVFKSMIDKFDYFKAENMSDTKEEIVPKQSLESKPTDNQENPNKNLPFLIGLFAILVIALLILLLKSSSTLVPSVKKTLVTPPVTNQITLSPSTAPPSQQLSLDNTASGSSQQNLKYINIQIQNGSGIPNGADLAKSRLQEAGFTNIVSQDVGILATAKTFIVFSKNLPIQIKQTITETISQIYKDVATQDTEGIKYDAIIFINKQN